jgi:tetratricopeptide (TPR) repeat protein
LAFFEGALIAWDGVGDREGLGDLTSNPRYEETAPGYFEVPFDAAEQALYDGLALESQGRRAESSEQIDRAISLEEGRARGHTYRANGALAAGDAETAISSLGRALELEPDAYEAQILAVFALHRAQRHEDAYERASKTWDAHPLNARMGMIHAQQLAERGATAAQIAVLESVIEVCPGYFVAWCALGLASFRHHRFAVARELLMRYLEVVPKNTDARFALAASELRLGRMAPGRAQLEALLEIQPDHVTARQLLQRL